jgi:alkylhydroperoxidase family enzyme
MARVPYLNAEDLDEPDRVLLSRPINLVRALVNNPGGARAFQDLGMWIRFDGQLDPRLRELAILQVGYLYRSDYEYSHHVKIGQDFGVTDDDLKLIGPQPGASADDAPEPDEPTALVLAAATEMVQHVELSEPTWQRAVALLGTPVAVELVLVIAHYCAVVRVLASLKIDVEPDYQPYLRDWGADRT